PTGARSPALHLDRHRRLREARRPARARLRRDGAAGAHAPDRLRRVRRRDGDSAREGAALPRPRARAGRRRGGAVARLHRRDRARRLPADGVDAAPLPPRRRAAARRAAERRPLCGRHAEVERGAGGEGRGRPALPPERLRPDRLRTGTEPQHRGRPGARSSGGAGAGTGPARNTRGMDRMKLRRTLLFGLAVALGGAAAAAAVGSGSSGLTNVASANPKVQGLSQPNILSPELAEVVVAQGSLKLDGGTSDVPTYGYDGNGPFVPTSFNGLAATEAQKTEPDKNTYLVLPGQHGADPGYDYGSHFLYQGHEATEAGVGAAITRVNLDADGAHRVTLLATQTQAGKPLHAIDGSTWDPWAH